MKSALSVSRMLALSIALLSAEISSAAEPVRARPPLLPAQSFAQLPAARHPTLSNDGKTILYQAVYDKDEAVVFMDVETGKVNAVEVAFDNGSGSTQWVSKDRIIYGGMAGIDRNGKNYKGLLGQPREKDMRDQQRIYAGGVIFKRFKGEEEGNVLMLEYDHPASYGRYGFAYLKYPHVIKMNTRTGAFARELTNPGKVTSWMTDGAGVVRIGVEFNAATAESRIIYRDNENTAWRTLGGLGFAKRELFPVWLSFDGKQLYVAIITPDKTWGVYAYDIPSQTLGDLILSHERYDILPLMGNVYMDGYGLQSIVTAPGTREVLGFRYMTDVPRNIWFDPTLTAIQTALNQSLPGKVNTIVDMSDDLKVFLVLSWSAKDPGTYYTFNLDKKELKAQVPRMPWIKPEQMAEVHTISYKARDGLVIRGYLTVPAGREPKNLPLIVYPHGGPFLRDAWGFDSDAQFLANRGYAVLQMNYRGSPGYGQEFYEKGMRKVGTDMQNDIEDGTLWAIEKGIANPKRVAIMGGSFGGYSALMGLMRTPDLYQCGISFAAVTDWPALFKYDKELDVLSYQSTVDHVGDPADPTSGLEAISPTRMADKLKAPLLLIYSKNDFRVPFEQARLLTDALDKAGKKYDYMSKFNEGHGFYGLKNRIQFLTKVEDFLAKNMPADPIPAVATK